MLLGYASIAAFFFVAAAFMVGSLLFGKLVRPSRPYPEKLATYECGEEAVGQAWFNFNPRFYVIALIYIVFDVEIAFIYPVAVVFKRWVSQGQGVFALLEILTFVGILLVGLGYVWTKGDLAWIRVMRAGARPPAISPERPAPALPPPQVLRSAGELGADVAPPVAGQEG